MHLLQGSLQFLLASLQISQFRGEGTVVAVEQLTFAAVRFIGLLEHLIELSVQFGQAFLQRLGCGRFAARIVGSRTSAVQSNLTQTDQSSCHGNATNASEQALQLRSKFLAEPAQRAVVDGANFHQPHKVHVVSAEVLQLATGTYATYQAIQDDTSHDARRDGRLAPAAVILRLPVTPITQRQQFVKNADFMVLRNRLFERRMKQEGLLSFQRCLSKILHPRISLSF